MDEPKERWLARLAGVADCTTLQAALRSDHILLVDDAPAIVYIPAEYLHAEGFVASEAFDGPAALECA